MLSNLRQHRQLDSMSCAASAVEAVLKLHGLIAPDDFPYQEKYRRKNIRFETIGHMADYGISPVVSEMELDDAISLIEQEVNEGRYPLVSLVVSDRGLALGWHIFIVARIATDLVLINPAWPNEVPFAPTTEAVRREFRRTLRAAPNQQFIHMATYSFVAQAAQS